MFPLPLILLLVAFVGFSVWRFITRKKSPFPLPPGPVDPIIGSVRHMPSYRPELTYIEWGKKYNSDILYINLLGQPMVILNKREDAVELLDRRGAKYMDRPILHFFDEMGWEDTITSKSNGPHFKRHRKAFQNGLSTGKCVQYQPMEQDEAKKLASRLVNKPENWMSEIQTFSTGIITRVAYGIEVSGRDDPYMKIGEKVSAGIGEGGSGSATILDIFPIIRKMPNWLSIFPSLKFTRDIRPYVEKLHQIPMDMVKDEMEKGIHNPSLVRSLLEDRKFREEHDEKADPEDELSERDIASVGGTVYGAGMDTTWSTTSIFILAMVLNPEVQRKAQAEIDTVVGTGRLPNFADRPNLPGVERVLMETFRYMPVVPLNIPHKAAEDDVLKGYFIPKGTLVVANSYAINHDPTSYTNPSNFNPDRYIPTSQGGEGAIPPVGQFGFGRRICPGQNLGNNNVWIAIATLLATVNIQKKKDGNWREITPGLKMTSGLTSHPIFFPCEFLPRSEKAVELLRRL